MSRCYLSLHSMDTASRHAIYPIRDNKRKSKKKSGKNLDKIGGKSGSKIGSKAIVRNIFNRPSHDVDLLNLKLKACASQPRYVSLSTKGNYHLNLIISFSKDHVEYPSFATSRFPLNKVHRICKKLSWYRYIRVLDKILNANTGSSGIGGERMMMSGYSQVYVLAVSNYAVIGYVSHTIYKVTSMMGFNEALQERYGKISGILMDAPQSKFHRCNKDNISLPYTEIPTHPIPNIASGIYEGNNVTYEK
jgi:hypothetical protein